MRRVPDMVEASREQASEIQQQLPGWMVLYGTYTKEFVAFPLFDAPPGTILTAAYPPALINRMRQAERLLRSRTRRNRGQP